MKNLFCVDRLLKENAYPGRGIIVGKSENGKNAVMAYFIMGRSENSRNRIFVPEAAEMRTKAFDPSKISDPSLIIYYPVRVNGNKTIVTNGDQTDTINDYLNVGKTFEEALRTREFEPDSPNFTPRVSAISEFNNGDFSYKMSILKSSGGDDRLCERFFYEYDKPIAGEGRFIHTYRCDGNPIPSFDGDPKPIAIKDNDIESFSDLLWDSLNEENKVSLFVRFVNLENLSEKTVIINKNK
ncbi:MAG: IMP cyclohydrolase [Oscillospiraceae bacterium]